MGFKEGLLQFLRKKRFTLASMCELAQSRYAVGRFAEAWRDGMSLLSGCPERALVDRDEVRLDLRLRLQEGKHLWAVVERRPRHGSG